MVTYSIFFLPNLYLHEGLKTLEIVWLGEASRDLYRSLEIWQLFFHLCLVGGSTINKHEFFSPYLSPFLKKWKIYSIFQPLPSTFSKLF